MKKKIIFQKCNFNNIYFLFYVISIFINLLIENYIYPDKSRIQDEKELNSYILPVKILLDIYIQNLSDFLAIIPHLIRNRLLKKKQSKISSVEIENTKDSEDLKLIYNDKNISITNKKIKTILLYIILIGILDFFEKLSLILYLIIYSNDNYNSYSFSCITPFEIIFQFICSYFILKIKFYKLQYFSLFLNLGIFIIILIIDIFNFKRAEYSWDGKVYIFYLFNIISYSFEFSLGKKIVLYGFISIYLLIFIRGSVELILSLLFSLILYLSKKDVFIKMGFFFSYKDYIGLMIAKIFSGFFSTLFVWLILDRFSPNYFPLSLILYEFISFIINIIYNSNYINAIKKNWDLYIRIFLYLISFIGVMIHNEIIVINICNLGSDTKYFLDLQVESDELFAKTDNPEIMKRFDSLIEINSDNPDINVNENETDN